MTTEAFKTLHIWDTKLNADSVEWCPVSPYKNFFACGTYFLNESADADEVDKDKKEYQRTGSVIIFAVNKDSLEVKHSIHCPAVLDMKWSNRKVNGNIALATANAAGEISLFYLEDCLLKFITKCTLKKEFGDFLILSLDWIKTTSPDLICSSDSQGNVTLIKVASNALQVLKEWKAHSLEAWTVCFDSFYPNKIYSGMVVEINPSKELRKYVRPEKFSCVTLLGGDEAEMKVWDCRCEDTLKIASSTKHKAGVTALNSNIYQENSLVSGSYDETVLFWDVRNCKSPKGSIVSGGGIWRLKWETRSRSRYLLAACIYGGFQMYDISSYLVVGEYKEHESLAYGADWCSLTSDEQKSLLNCKESALIATCSFYDHKLCVSSWSENPNNQD